jgi:hypothetical protein
VSVDFAKPRVYPDRMPMRVRFFQEPDIADLEAAVNAWLVLDPRREIVHVQQTAIQSASGPAILVSVWYIGD